MKLRDSSEDKVVLVIGASGFLGRNIVDGLEPAHNVIFTSYRTPRLNAVPYNFFSDDIGDILDKFAVTTVIFSAATEKEARSDFEVSVERFVLGCKDRRLVYLSSDAVFDGERGRYTERCIPSPVTSYGRNLLHFETVIKEAHSDYCVIRPSYIYGFSDGLDVRLNRARATLQAGREMTSFDDMFKSPLGVEQVAEAVVTLGFSDFTGVVHVAGERMSVFDFYTKAMKALNVSVDGLKRELMPGGSGLTPDTSLDTSLWQQLTGAKPLSIEDTLST